MSFVTPRYHQFSELTAVHVLHKRRQEPVRYQSFDNRYCHHRLLQCTIGRHRPRGPLDSQTLCCLCCCKLSCLSGSSENVTDIPCKLDDSLYGAWMKCWGLTEHYKTFLRDNLHTAYIHYIIMPDDIFDLDPLLVDHTGCLESLPQCSAVAVIATVIVIIVHQY